MSEKKSVTLAVPSGIGDVSWILSKIYGQADKVDIHIEVADGAPYRTLPFLELFPWIKSCKYGDFNYNDLMIGMEMQRLDTWEKIVNGDYGRVWLSNNLHLEQGKRLEDFLPELPTDFHYPIPITARAERRAAGLLRGADGYLIGISAASYRGASAWKTWGYEDWAEFLDLVRERLPNVTFILMGGGWDDLTRSLFDEFNFCAIDTVGKTGISTALAIHERLDGYIGFSSGLGIIRTVLGLKTFMLWPDFQTNLSTSWAPPEMLASGDYTAHLWRSPEIVIKAVEPWLEGMK